MTARMIRLFSQCSALSLLSALVSGCAATSDQVSEEESASVTQLWTELAPVQSAANAFYAPDNIIDITIRFASYQTWKNIKTVLPKDATGVPSEAGVCAHLPVNGSGESPDRYDWVAPTSVTIRDSKDVFPSEGTTWSSSDVDIKKKSYCGSLTIGEDEQPSIKLRLKNSLAVSKLGGQYLTLNNSKQDGSKIRQNLGYYLIGLAGLPHPRVNYARVHVTFADGTATQDYTAINVEPVRGSFINNPDNGFAQPSITQSGSSDARAKGNLYEISIGSDFNATGHNETGTEKVSAIQGIARPDFEYAISQLANGTASAATLKKIVDADQFARFWAMEVLLRHGDGYTTNVNNTYIYNDVVATSGTQSDATVNFKFIHYGIDEILRAGSNFRIEEGPVVPKIFRNDAELYNKFLSAITYVRQTVFSRDRMDNEINARIDLLRSQLLSFGVDTTAEIDSIRLQLRRARAAAIVLTGSASSSFYLASRDTGDVIHGSVSEKSGIYNEVYHRTYANDATNRWIQGWNSGITFINEGTGMALYASASLKTPAGHVAIYQEPVGNYPSGEAWSLEYEGLSSYGDGKLHTFPATFRLRSSRTGAYAHYSSSDLTPNGNPRVYQSNADGATSLFMY